MNLQHIIDVAKAEARKVSTWARVGLLLAVDYAPDIYRGVQQSLPALREYLPDNIYKTVGIAVIVAGVVFSARRSSAAVKADQ